MQTQTTPDLQKAELRTCYFCASGQQFRCLPEFPLACKPHGQVMCWLGFFSFQFQLCVERHFEIMQMYRFDSPFTVMFHIHVNSNSDSNLHYKYVYIHTHTYFAHHDLEPWSVELRVCSTCANRLAAGVVSAPTFAYSASALERLQDEILA